MQTGLWDVHADEKPVLWYALYSEEWKSNICYANVMYYMATKYKQAQQGTS